MKETSQRNKFVALRARGLSFANIAKQLNISKPTLIRWSRDLKEDIANLVEIEREELRKKYRLTMEHRLEMFTAELGKICAELQKRDLSDLSTNALLNQFLKFSFLAREEEKQGVTLSEKNDLSDFSHSITGVDRWTV